MWGLEFALLFGAPENKLELFDGCRLTVKTSGGDYELALPEKEGAAIAAPAAVTRSVATTFRGAVMIQFATPSLERIRP